MAGRKGRSGGHRPGAGRKARTARLVALQGGQDRRVIRPIAVPVAVLDRPDGLPSDVGAVWDELVEHARAAGTLVPGTLPAFLRLCRSVATQGRWQAQIEKEGDTYLKVTIDGSGQEHTEVKAHPLIGKAQTLENAIRSGLKDFAIHPFGKSLAAPVVAADPFAEFDQASRGRG